MLSTFLAAAVAIVPVEKAPTTAATASAQAVVRIVRGAEIRFEKPLRFDAAIARETSIRERDGSARTASLVEFY
jgi:acyl-CoA thioesterase FadM